MRASKGEKYISDVYESLLRQGKSIKIVNNCSHPILLGTPHDYFEADPIA